MSILSYSCAELGQYLLNNCGEELLTELSQAILLDEGHGITNFSNPAQYTAALNAGTATHLPAILASIPDPAPSAVSPNVAGETDTVTTYDRTATILDGNVNLTNDTFWDSATVGRRFAGIVFYNGSDEDNPHVIVIIGRIKITGGLGANNGENQRYSLTLGWRRKTGPRHYPAPAGIFD
ncbi:MAG: hypothetical protein ACRCST_13070 [Turicibacter sp.]